MSVSGAAGGSAPAPSGSSTTPLSLPGAPGLVVVRLPGPVGPRRRNRPRGRAAVGGAPRALPRDASCPVDPRLLGPTERAWPSQAVRFTAARAGPTADPPRPRPPGGTSSPPRRGGPHDSSRTPGPGAGRGPCSPQRTSGGHRSEVLTPGLRRRFLKRPALAPNHHGSVGLRGLREGGRTPPGFCFKRPRGVAGPRPGPHPA